jgi:hypothetical protein
MRDTARVTVGTMLAEFECAEDLVHALRVLRAKGYTQVETYTPYDVPGVAPLLGGRRTRLPLFIFAGGLFGAVASYAIQWYANAYAYPLNIGNRPAHAVPAFIVPTFEGTILCAALAAFFGVLAILRLPRLWKPVFEVEGFERASIDRYWIAVDAGDHRVDAALTPRELTRLKALRVVRAEAAS